MTDYADLVEYIVKNIVDNPDSVEIETSQGRGRSETVEIRLDPGDVGRVIGKGGRNIEAIRSVVKASAIKEHHRVNVEVIADDEQPDREDALAGTEMEVEGDAGGAEPGDAEPGDAEPAPEPVATADADADARDREPVEG